MTNREYLSQNPEEMRGILKKAKEYVEKTCGVHERLIMGDDELLDKWLSAEHQPETSTRERRETTYIVNVALTIHHADSMNADEAEQIARVASKALKRAIAQVPSLHDIDDVTIERVKEFIWG